MAAVESLGDYRTSLRFRSGANRRGAVRPIWESRDGVDSIMNLVRLSIFLPGTPAAIAGRVERMAVSLIP